MPDKKKRLTIDEQVSIARQDLAQRLEVNPDQLTVESAQYVNWRSGAAGCPQPGMSYTMAIVRGVLILLRVDRATYRYHAVRGKSPFYCPSTQAQEPATGADGDVM